jgi:membrane-associated phospholipid phosphatase
VLHVAAAYALGNVVAGIGKPVIGRHRPDTLGSPWRIRPFTIAGARHSFPSAHTLHAFTLAGAISEEAHQPWVTASAYGAAMLVGWSRVYSDEHWASDVVASAILGAAIGHVTVRYLHSRNRRR